MELLRAMRFAEVAALRFLLSLLEEEELDQNDSDYAEQQLLVVEHKTLTIKRMVEELKPKILCDKIITHWNLSPEVDDPQYEVEPIQDDDEVIENDTAERVIRPKREVQCETYLLLDQKDHCLEICALCYSVFNAVITAPELKTSLFQEVVIERPQLSEKDTESLSSNTHWQLYKSKVYDHFIDKVLKLHNKKYLHFLFGQVEIVRGSRLQKMFFLVPRPVRVLKNHSLIHQWQEDCLTNVDRTSPEAQIDNFAELVMGQYISFVRTQFSLSQKPWPFNRAGEADSFCVAATMVTTTIINGIMIPVYAGSYSHTLFGTWSCTTRSTSGSIFSGALRPCTLFFQWYGYSSTSSLTVGG